MLESIAYIFLLGMGSGWVCKKIHLPSLVGMLLTGIVLGPYVLNRIDSSLLNISSDIRQIALIIILLRAGLSLDISDLKKVGRPAILMCFLPACFEIVGMMLLAPRLLSISVLDAAIVGCVIAAVSPAVIVPKMLLLMKQRYGTNKSIPQLILAGASVDDVFVIVLFTACTSLAQGGSLTIQTYLNLPVSIILGVCIGCLIGYVCSICFQKIHLRDTNKVILLLCIAFLMVTLEDCVTSIVPFSSLIAILCMGLTMQKKREVVALRLSNKFQKLWIVSEVFLFVFVGTTLNLQYVSSVGFMMVFLILLVLLFRMIGVVLCLLKTKFSYKERIFCMFAYIPKATVQAAIGGVPLAMGLSCGNVVLTMAVLAILISAPLGAFLIDHSYQYLLEQANEQ